MGLTRFCGCFAMLMSREQLEQRSRRHIYILSFPHPVGACLRQRKRFHGGLLLYIGYNLRPERGFAVEIRHTRFRGCSCSYSCSMPSILKDTASP